MTSPLPMWTAFSVTTGTTARLHLSPARHSLSRSSACRSTATSRFKALRTWTSERLPSCQLMSLGELKDLGWLSVRQGHGSPSLDLRSGDIPYIKVSDIRSGTVNPNSTNMVSDVIAEKFWEGSVSGLKPWDVITPARASKNIGEPAITSWSGAGRLYKGGSGIQSDRSGCLRQLLHRMGAMLRPVNAQWERWSSCRRTVRTWAIAGGSIQSPFRRGGSNQILSLCATKGYYKGLAKLRTDFQKNLSTWK